MTALRSRLRLMSFRERLVLLVASAVAIAVVVASAVVYVVVRDELRGHVDDQLRGLIADVKPPRQVANPYTGERVLLLPPTPLGGAEGYAQIVQLDGTVIRPPGDRVELPVTQRTLAVAAGKAGAYFHDITIGGEHARVYTRRLEAGNAVQGVTSLEEIDHTLGRLALALILVSIGGVAIAVALGFMVARTALRPVRTLTSAAEHVARTRDLSRRIEAEGSDELSRLGASFNTMLEALEDSQRAQRQLIGDASHELRTPLTSLRTNMEVLSDVESLPPEDRRRLVHDVVAQLDELTVLITDLVDLARGDERPEVTQDVRLDMLVSEAVDRFRRHASDKQFNVDLQPSLVVGVPGRLDRAIANLLDNAAKWSPPGGTVDVRLRDGSLEVRDRGPGFNEEDLPLVFERFYRATDARKLPGSGLGLAIVRQVADAHGAKVEAENAVGGGALLRLSFDQATVLRPPQLVGPLPPHRARDQPVEDAVR
jgi:two-component system, OmpR family, sensor histidine kinase MprB